MSKMIQKFYAVILVVLCLPTVTHAQVAEWVTPMGGTSDDIGRCITTDAAGNVFTTGYFQGTATFTSAVPGSNNVSFTSTGSYDIFVTKQDPTGRLIWAKKYGGGGDDRGNGIVADAYGHLYVTGQVANNATFAPGAGTVTTSGLDVFLLKIDTAGNYLWVKTASGPGTNDFAFKVALDPWNGVYLGGQFNSSGAGLIFGSTALTTSGGGDAFVAKADTAGNFIWAKKVGGNADDIAYTITADRKGGVVIAGAIRSLNITVAPGISISAASSGIDDAWVARLDTAGNFKWASRWGNSTADIAWSVATDEDGNIYTAGTFIGSRIDFDPGSGAADTFYMSSQVATKRSVYWSKLDSNGKFMMARSVMMDDGTGAGIAVDKNRNVYVAGGFVTNATFGTSTINSSGSWDAYLAKWNANGDFDWRAIQHGTGEDFMYNVTTDANNNVYTTGYAKSTTLTVDGNSYSLKGQGDIIIFKVAAPSVCATTYTTLNEKACDQYNFRGNIKTTTGTYRDTLMNAAGCDSVITLNLVIDNRTQYSFSEVACDSFLFLGKTLKQTGVYRDTIVNAAGCDSVIIMDLEIRRSTSATLVRKVCDSFVLDGTVYRTTGIYNQTLKNTAQCDSFVTLDVEILSASHTVSEEACDSFFYDGITYKASGIYAHAFSNVSGCDSLVSLDLTIKRSTQYTFSESSCGSYGWAGTMYDTTGTYAQVFQNAAGCDSFVTLNLTVLSPDVHVVRNDRLLTASLGFDSYQWLDCNDGGRPVGSLQIFDVPVSGGSYAVAVMMGSCMDTSDCITVEPLSVEDMYASDFRIYPNPVADILTIVSSDVGRMETVEVRLMDIHGKVISIQPVLQGAIMTIDIRHVLPGIYLVEISNGKAPVRHRIMKL